MKDWWVYNGKETSKCLKTLKAIKDVKPKWRDKKYPKHNAENFDILGNDKLLDAVNAAIYLRRPLLVTGDPGIGKSTLAKSIAKHLTDSEHLSWHITSKSVLQDALYSYDAMSRLQELQMKKMLNDLGKTNDSDDIQTDIGNYIKLGAIGEAFISDKPKVVLIDEIDKSDIDLPNDLLHIFEEQDFIIEEVKRTKEKNVKVCKYSIPEDGKIKCEGDFPIIIMTSNGDREFPPAFLRRCISIEISLPDNKDEQIILLTKMVLGHFIDDEFEDKDAKDKLDELVKEFVDLKLDKKLLLSNDQLLNAAFLVLESDLSLEEFKDNILASLE